MQYTYIFGPVPSRRLGISLGLDITPDKNCTFNCIYCECGKTEELTIQRKEYAPTADIIEELRRYLSDAPELDAITFSGSGEPTLHSGLGEIIAFLKSHYPQYRIVVITNSSLLHRVDVRDDIANADVIIPSLDAVSEEAFHKINRPQPALSSAELIEGLRTFTNAYSGEIWLEIFVVPGINDTEEEIAQFRKTLGTLRYDRLQLNSLDRPAAVSWLKDATPDQMERFAALLGIPAEIVSRKGARKASPGYNTSVAERILATIRVRPCTAEDLCTSLGLHEHEAAKYLEALIEERKAEVVLRGETEFYRAATT